jgi:hypothetical protein
MVLVRRMVPGSSSGQPVTGRCGPTMSETKGMRGPFGLANDASRSIELYTRG